MANVTALPQHVWRCSASSVETCRGRSLLSLLVLLSYSIPQRPLGIRQGPVQSAEPPTTFEVLSRKPQGDGFSPPLSCFFFFFSTPPAKSLKESRLAALGFHLDLPQDAEPDVQSSRFQRPGRGLPADE